MNPQIIALTGLAGAGKDSVAHVLATHCNFSVLAFADPLRAEVSQAYNLAAAEAPLLTDRALKHAPTARLALIECKDDGFTGTVIANMLRASQPVDRDTLTAPRTPRQILQWWGTEYRRSTSSGYWTSRMAQRVRDYIRDGQTRFVITDCRFENEAHLIRRLGGFIWQIERAAARAAALEGQHASVNDGSAFNPSEVIDNNGTLLDLRSKVLATWWSVESGVHIERLEVAA